MLEEGIHQRIQTLMPGILVDRLEINQEGLINDVAIVNEQWVFRFAKTDRYADILELELTILDLVRPRVSLSLPSPVQRQRGAVVYPLLRGQPFTRALLFNLDDHAREQVTVQIGEFLFALHSTPVTTFADTLPATLAPVTLERWQDIRQRSREKIYPLLLKHQVQWAENLFNSMLDTPGAFEFEPVLVHGDLAPYHILFDEQSSCISGVIDFGVAGMGDPALDLGSLINVYGESFVRKMHASYPDLGSLLPRARFYAQSIELQWVLLGLESGETFWFTAHLAGARDILR